MVEFLCSSISFIIDIDEHTFDCQTQDLKNISWENLTYVAGGTLRIECNNDCSGFEFKESLFLYFLDQLIELDDWFKNHESMVIAAENQSFSLRFDKHGEMIHIYNEKSEDSSKILIVSKEQLDFAIRQYVIVTKQLLLSSYPVLSKNIDFQSKLGAIQILS